jgi:hypothetical protein
MSTFSWKQFMAWSKHQGFGTQRLTISWMLWFNTSKLDHNLYFLVQGGKYVVLILYIDDLFLIGDNTRAWNPETKLH